MKFCLRQQLFLFKEFAWKRDCLISSELQTSRISPSYIQIENVKTTRLLFLKAVEFCSNFDIQIDLTLEKNLEKFAKPHFLESSQKSLRTRQNSYH